MAITNLIDLNNALKKSIPNRFQRGSLANATSGLTWSTWRSTGQPGQGVIPTAAAVCNATTVGSIPYTQPLSPSKAYIGEMQIDYGSLAASFEIHDRLVHMGGLSGTVITAQTVGIDLNSLLATSNLDQRKGDANYSDVQWWLEWYADTGATASNTTVNVTYDDGSTGNLTVFLIGRRIGQWQNLNQYIPVGGRFIRGVNSVTLSATTGTAGNFGVTATRYRCNVLNNNDPNFGAYVETWDKLGLPEVFANSCLMVGTVAATTTTQIVSGHIKIIYG